jgi:hypothetical protein
LPDYTCVQTVNRSYFARAHLEYPTPSCDLIAAEKKRRAYRLILQATDRLRLNIKVSGDEEIASWAGEKHFDSRNVHDLIGGGPYGTGSLGTMINDILVNGRTSLRYTGERTVDGLTLFTYSFFVPASASHYYMLTGSNTYTTAYDGTLSIEPHSFDLKRLVVRTSELPRKPKPARRPRRWTTSERLPAMENSSCPGKARSISS